MHKDTLNAVMAIFLLAIIVVTLVLFSIEFLKHLMKVIHAILKPSRLPFTGPAPEDPDDDPYGVGMNDKDIL
jgi:hypothetical protein